MRQPKPFFRKFTQTWYLTLNGKQINLGPDEEAAFEKYHELMAGRGLAQTRYSSVAHLFDGYPALGRQELTGIMPNCLQTQWSHSLTIRTRNAPCCY